MKILIVEDEHKIANSIKRGLEIENFTVDVAYDGEDGYDLASSEKYDCIVLDLMLPGLNGIEICNKLRAEKNHTPILMLTALGETDDKVKGLNTGADDYMSKPFAFTELLARIRALSRRPQSVEETIITYDSLSLNTLNFEVKRANKVIGLSKKEYVLLEYLIKHKELVLSKDQIITNVWDYESDILPNTVEVYIGYLRNKIDRKFSKEKPLIHTIRGFGYKISVEK